MRSVEVPLIPGRKLVLWTLGVTAVIGCFWLLWRFQEVILLLFTAVILSTAVRPGVRWLDKRGIPKPAGILLIFGLIGLLLGLLLWYSLPILARQGTAIAQNLTEGYHSLRQSLQHLPNILVRRLLAILPETLPPISSGGADLPVTDSELPAAAGNQQGNRLLTGLVQFFIVGILTFFGKLLGRPARGWLMKQIMIYTAVILATLAALVILWQFKLALLLFVLSLFVAAAIRPFVDSFIELGVPKNFAQLLFYVLGIGSFLLVMLLVGDLLIQEFNVAANRLVVEYEAWHQRWQVGAGWQQTAVGLLPLSFIPATAQEAELQQMAPVVMNITRGLTGAVGGTLLLLVASIYWSADQHRFERLWLSLLPAKRRVYARDSWRKVEETVGSYLRSQMIQSLLAGLFLAAGSTLIGFKFPLLLAFAGALATFVPLFGGLLTAVFALTLGSLESTGMGLAAAGLTLIIFICLELIVEPYLWPRKRRSFLLTILVILPLFELFGVWGLVVAPLLAAAIEALGSEAYQTYIGGRDTALQLEGLAARCQQLTQKVTSAEQEAASPELKNLSQRLAVLLSDSQKLIRSK